LIDNAVDAAAATQATHRVTVSLREDADGLRIQVADGGAGVAPEHAEEIFTRGWTKKNEAGHGIGLALVRHTVARNGGSIEVARDPVLGGAVITVDLPSRAVCDVQNGARAAAEGALKSTADKDRAEVWPHD
jgi:sensor histidine kinase regulating citrate/malate metabolism